MKNKFRIAVLIIGVLAAVPYSFGTQLIFEPTVGSFVDFVPLAPGYGNNVVATNQGGYKYDLSGGATPNVVTQYATAGMPTIYTWAEDFGDLHHVIFAQEPQVFQFKLIADPGFLVTLNSFDMASWPHLDYTINSVEVQDGNGATLFLQGNPLIEGDSSGPQHTHFSFSGVRAQTLNIIFDSTNVDSDDVGIDNINFSQTTAGVPEPASFVMLGSGLLGLLCYRWQRRR